MEKLLAAQDDLVTDISDFLGDIESMQFIGRGPSFSTALQCELMFKEAAKKAAAGTLGGEFRHGPMENGRPRIQIDIVRRGRRNVYPKCYDGHGYGQIRGESCLITNKNPHGNSEANIKVITIDQPDEYLFSIQSIIPVQLMVNRLASMNGNLPGTFVHGSKVTLKE